MQRRLQRNPDNGYDVGHAEGRRRGQDDDLNGGHDDVQDVGADVGDSGWIHESLTIETQFLYKRTLVICLWLIRLINFPNGRLMGDYFSVAND